MPEQKKWLSIAMLQNNQTLLNKRLIPLAHLLLLFVLMLKRSFLKDYVHGQKEGLKRFHSILLLLLNLWKLRGPVRLSYSRLKKMVLWRVMIFR